MSSSGSPFTPELVRLINALHAQFLAEGRSGHITIELHYAAGTPKIQKLKGPEVIFSLSS